MAGYGSSAFCSSSPASWLISALEERESSCKLELRGLLLGSAAISTAATSADEVG
jgi:hypothetical protein